MSAQPTQPATQSPLQRSIHLGLSAARENIKPAILLWIVGLTLVLLYYFSPPVTAALSQLGELKDTYSPWLGMLTTGIAGGLLPWILQKIFPTSTPAQPLRQVALYFTFWCINGYQVDWLYSTQSAIFGDSADLATIVKKLLVDQLLWAPLLMVPQLIFCYVLIDNNLSLRKARQALRASPFIERYIPLMLLGWTVWLPAVCIIYLFPLPLQLPLQNIILTLWSLILIFCTKNSKSD